MSKRDTAYTPGKWFMIGLFGCFILFGGDPDIADGIIAFLKEVAK